MSIAPQFDITTPEFKTAPYDFLAYLRENAPVSKVALPGGREAWLVTRYEDVEEAYKDHRFTPNPRYVYPAEVISALFPTGIGIALSNSMLLANPPDHTRLRRLVSASFTPRYIEQWRGRIAALTEELFVDLPEHGELDLIDKVTSPLPMNVISAMLGIPKEDGEKFRQWTILYADSVGDIETGMKIRQEMEEFLGYLQYLIAEKRKHPDEALLSQLIQTVDGGDRLTEDELVGTIIVLLLAGNETTTSFLGNVMLALFRHPDQLALLKENPALLKSSALEEFLRYHGPLMNGNDRWVLEDMEFRGQQMKKGDQIYLCVASANRDGAQFENGNSLDITRKESSQHIAFGKGIHFCLGAPLARLEGQIGLEAILRHMPDIQLNIDPKDLVWRPGATTFALAHLPVKY